VAAGTALEPLLPPGLVLDTHREFGFTAIALVQTENLRPAFLPASFGLDFFLTGYRIFVRVADAPSLRGPLHRSQRHRPPRDGRARKPAHPLPLPPRGHLQRGARWTLEVRARSAAHDADLDIVADLTSKPAPLPSGSPFADAAEARRYAGPLPYTFDYDRSTGSIIAVHATRQSWNAEPIGVEVRKATFLAAPDFADAQPVLANAFHVQNLDYRWERGELLRR
jgi:hypothetical protein